MPLGGSQGSPTPAKCAPDADLRTDLPRYRLFRNGELVDEPADLNELWQPDSVAPGGRIDATLGASILGRPYEVSGETLEPSQVKPSTEQGDRLLGLVLLPAIEGKGGQRPAQ